jgi:hypothetical protein
VCGVSDVRKSVARSEPMIPFGASWVLVSSASTLVSVLNCSLLAERVLASGAIKPDRARRCLDERGSSQPLLSADTSQHRWLRVSEEDSGLPSAIRARDVRAADLQEESTKRLRERG